MAQCIICNTGSEKLVLVTDRGKASLRKFAELRGDDGVLKALAESNTCHVHEHCRKYFNNQRRINLELQSKPQTENEINRPETRAKFSWKKD